MNTSYIYGDFRDVDFLTARASYLIGAGFCFALKTGNKCSACFVSVHRYQLRCITPVRTAITIQLLHLGDEFWDFRGIKLQQPVTKSFISTLNEMRGAVFSAQTLLIHKHPISVQWCSISFHLIQHQLYVSPILGPWIDQHCLIRTEQCKLECAQQVENVQWFLK